MAHETKHTWPYPLFWLCLHHTPSSCLHTVTLAIFPSLILTELPSSNLARAIPLAWNDHSSAINLSIVSSGRASWLNKIRPLFILLSTVCPSFPAWSQLHFYISLYPFLTVSMMAVRASTAFVCQHNALHIACIKHWLNERMNVCKIDLEQILSALKVHRTNG